MCLDCLIYGLDCLICAMFGRPRGAVGMRNRQCLLEDCIQNLALTVLYVPESGLDCLMCALTVLYVP